MRNTAAFTGIFGAARLGRWLAGLGLLAVAGLPPARAQPAPAANLSEIRTRAEQSDPDAQNVLGNLYTNGLLGVKQDYAEALRWYRKAAEKGYAPAQFNLGLASELGRGQPADERQAFKYYLMAAEQGFAAAQFNVGNMYSAGRGVGQDLFEANLWYKQAAEKGVIEAQFNLGLAYEAGRGVKKDEVQAARWYKQAADHGFARAQYNLGLLLEDGRGVPKNETAAAGFYRAAAEQGFALAQNNYGLMLFEGRGGLPKDPVQAYVWLSLAVANGANPSARDFAAKSLSAAQLAAANDLLSERAAAPAAAPARAGPPPAAVPAALPPVAPAASAAAARVAELTEALEKARQANTQFAETNQRLELEKARLEQELSRGGDAGKLMEQMREQSRRLMEQVEKLTADKEAAQRETTVLAAEVRDARAELAQQKAAPGPAAQAGAPADAAKYEDQIATLTARLEQMKGALSKLQQANQDLADESIQLQKEKKEALAVAAVAAAATASAAQAGPAAPTEAGKYPVQDADKDAIITNLQRDNARLNDEVKRSTRELLSLNQQIRNLRNQAPKPVTGATDNTASAELRTESQRVDANNTRLQSQRDAAVSDAENLMGQLREARGEITRLNEQIQQLRSTRQSTDAASDQLAQLNSKAATAAAESGRLQAENSRLAARVAELEKQRKPVADETLAPRLAQAQEAVAQLQQQLQAVQKDKAGLETLSQTQQKTLQESAAQAQAAGKAAADVQQKLAEAQKQLADREAALAAQAQDARKLAQDNQALVEKAATAATAAADASRLQAENSRLAARVAELEKQPKPVVDETLAPRLAQAQETVAQLQQQLQAAQTEKAGLDKKLRDSAELAQTAGTETAGLRQKLMDAQTQLADKGAALAAQAQEAREREQENRALAEKVRHAEEALVAQASDKTAQEESNKLRQQLQSLQAEKSGLEKTLRESTELAQTAGMQAADVRQKLAEAQKQLADREAALTAREQEARKLAQDNQALAEKAATAATAAADVSRLQAENGRLAAHLTELEKQPKPVVDETLAPRLAQAQETITQLQQQLQALQTDKAALEHLSQAQEKSLKETAAQAQTAGTEAAGLRQKLTGAQKLLADKEAALAAAKLSADTVGRVKAQLQEVQAEKARLEKLAQAQEKSLKEMTAQAQAAGTETAGLRQKLTEAQKQLADREAALATREQEAAKLAQENQALTDKAKQAEEALAAQAANKPAAEEAGKLRQQLAELQDRSDQLTRENQALADKAEAVRGSFVNAQARVTALESELRAAQKRSPDTAAGAEDLKRQLADTNQLLAKSAAMVAELTAANQNREQELAQAKSQITSDKQTLLDTSAQREELEQLRNEAAALATLREQHKALTEEAATLRAKNEQLARDGDQLAGLLKGGQRDIEQARARVAELEKQLAEARTTGTHGEEDAKKLQAQLAELTAAKAGLEKDLAQAKQSGADTDALRGELARLRTEAGETDKLREENSRLAKAAEEAATLRAKNEQLTRDGEQLASFMTGNRRDLDAAQARVAELEKQLEEARTIRTHGGDDTKKLQGDLAEANQSIEKLNATVAELTGANDRLEKDLDSARKSTAAALAAQSQAVTAAQPDAYKMEIGTLQAHVKELEGQMEEERNNTAKEIATLAAQLQRTRETNKSLTEANRALLSAKQSETPTVDKDEFDKLQAQVRDLAAAGEELRRQNQKLAAENQGFTTERASFKQQLEDARKAATVAPGLADEKAALQERLEAVGAQLLKTQQDLDSLQKDHADTVAQAAASKQAADKALADLAAVQNRAAEAEKASDSHNASVAELTQANTKLELEREDMRRLVESYRADINRLTQGVRSAEQQRAEAERGAQQNVDAVTAQMAQLRRDLESTRATQARMAEAAAAQERDRVAIITQLRTENSALAARLNQAQGTLDQIASAARLGTPAATIASGGLAPVRPAAVPAAAAPADVRYHTVAEGDSLSRISMRYYGTPNRWQEIFQANREVLQGSSVLRVGMQLRIP